METESPFSAGNPSTVAEVSSDFISLLPPLTPIPLWVSKEDAIGVVGFLEPVLGFEEVGSVSVVWRGWVSSGPGVAPGSFVSVWVDREGDGGFVGGGPKEVVQAAMSSRRRT